MYIMYMHMYMYIIYIGSIYVHNDYDLNTRRNGEYVYRTFASRVMINTKQHL